MAQKKQITLHKTAASKSRKRVPPRGSRKQRNSLMPLWILLVILLVGGVTVVTTIKSNTRKAAANAYALEKQRKAAAEVCERISDTVASVSRLNAKVSPMRSKTSERIEAVLASLPKVDKDAPPANGANAAYAGRPQLKTDAEKLKGFEKELSDALRTIEGCHLGTQDILDSAKRDEQEIWRERDNTRAKAKVASLGTMLPRAEDKRKQATKAYALAETIAADIYALADKIVEDERLRKEQETREREAKAQAKRVKEDTARESQQRAAMLPLMASFQPENALQNLNLQADKYQTEAGRESHSLMVEQCEAVVAMKAEVIKRLTAAPFAWGWRQDGAPRDIDGATTEHISVGDRTVLWQDISLKQLTAILTKYVCGSSVTPKLRSDHCVAAAIYFSTNGRDDAAKMMIEEGVGMRPSLRKEVDRLTSTILGP
jgi:hypothetical protein